MASVSLIPAIPAVIFRAPLVLLTAALINTSLVAPLAVSATAPEPPAVTAAPIVCVPLEVRLMLPLAAVVIALVVVVIAPALVTVSLPFAAVLLMPVIVNGFAVLVSAMLPFAPAPLFVALKLLTVLLALVSV